MSEYIAKLEHLTTVLPKSPYAVPPDAKKIIFAAEDENDSPTETWGLLKKSGVAVLDAFCPEGTTFPLHEHEQIEMLIVYEGCAHVECTQCGLTKDVHVGESITMPKNTPHKIYFPMDTWLIGITIPADEGYPNAPRRDIS